MASEQPPSTAASPYTTPIEYRVLYVLPEHFDCEKLEKSSSIEFDADYINEKNAYKIKGFSITVTAENEEEMLKKANAQAERLVQVMTVKSLGYVKYYQHGYSQKVSADRTILQIELRSGYHIRQLIDQLNLDSNQAIRSIMKDDENTNMELYHARLAINAAENSQFSDMYKELFQVIEKLKSFPDYKKWKSLRSALSHQKPVENARIEIECYFGKDRYEFTTNNEFNHFPDKNRENLEKDAKDLRKKVMDYLTPKLR